jgi:hemerythrin-like domain-containing protein
MNLIDGLRGEHATLLTLFNYLEKWSHGWDFARLQEAGAMLEALLLTHAELEDSLLFDTLGGRQGALDTTLEAMGADHYQLSNLLGQLRDMEGDDAKQARATLMQIIEVAREHFAIEERTLFGIAARLIGEARLFDLGAQWAKRRQVSAE